jgi:hypothetical protein
MKSLFSLIMALAVILTSAPVQAADSQAAWGSEAYYIVMRQLADGSILPASYQRVQMTAALESLDEPTLRANLLSGGESYIIHLQDDKGETIYQNVANVPRLLRGEFAAKPSQEGIDGYSFPLKETVFVVRVPVIPQTRLVLLDSAKRSLAEFDLDALSSAPGAQSGPPIYPVTPLQVTGSPDNRVDMVILGDGYTTAEQSKFVNDATAVSNLFFNISPLAEYKNYYNIYATYAASNQSGADHPLYDPTCIAGNPNCCADSTMLSDPLNGQFKDTVFDSTYCFYNIHRLLVPTDTVAVFTVAAAVPGWDTILVVVNDSTYGGSGGTFAVFSTSASAVEIAKHEFGHSFGWLADEYTIGTPGSCNDLDGNPANDCASNVTNATTRELTKWNYWILGTTPIPTPADGTYINDVGLFQGALYDPVNYYRSGENCLMRNLSRPWCTVPGQTMVLRLYQGGWGNPWGGISLIEPGTVFPASDTVSMNVGAAQTFKATLLTPLVPVSTTWWVDGVLQPGANTNTFLFTSASPGTYTITLRVADQGPFVHPTAAGSQLTFDQTWTATVSVVAYLPVIMQVSSGKIVLRQFFPILKTP